MRSALSLALGAALLAACPAHPSNAPGPAGSSEQIASPRADGQAAGGTSASPRADAGPPVPAGPPVSVSFHLVNSTGRPMYFNYVREWREAFTIEHREGEGADWHAVSYYTSMPPSALCPERGAPESCPSFMPSTPLPTVQPLTTLDYTWAGTVFDLEEVRVGCQCLRERRAAPGRYRARLCLHPTYECSQPSCRTASGGEIMPAFPTGEETCLQAEFDLADTDRAVTLEAGADSAPR